jgi:uncharacterized protein YggU (UPF0235/DUF167 family)
VAIEFAIVVLGIFVDFQAEDWNQGRLDRQLGKVYIARLIDETKAIVLDSAVQAADRGNSLASTENVITVPNEKEWVWVMGAVSFKLAVKVVPGSSRSGIAGWLGDTLRVRVTASPERGKANKAVEALLSEVLALPSGGARIVAGESSPRKTVEIIGISESEIRRRLSDAVPCGPRS